MSIPIGVDQTDHVAFFCPECRLAMKVKKVETLRVDTGIGKKDKCTWIHCFCQLHGYKGWRKFYWTDEDGENCIIRTDDLLRNQ